MLVLGLLRGYYEVATKLYILDRFSIMLASYYTCTLLLLSCCCEALARRYILNYLLFSLYSVYKLIILIIIYYLS